MLEERASGEHVRCRVGGAVITAGSFNALPFEAIVHTVPPFWPRAADHPTDDGGASLAAAREEWAVQLGRRALLTVAPLTTALLTMYGPTHYESTHY